MALNHWMVLILCSYAMQCLLHSSAGTNLLSSHLRNGKMVVVTESFCKWKSEYKIFPRNKITHFKFKWLVNKKLGLEGKSD